MKNETEELNTLDLVLDNGGVIEFSYPLSKLVFVLGELESNLHNNEPWDITYLLGCRAIYQTHLLTTINMWRVIGVCS